MLKSDQVLDPVIACSDYLYKQICKTLFYFLEIHSKRAGLMPVCQQEVFSGGNVSFGTGSVAQFGSFVSLARWTGH